MEESKVIVVVVILGMVAIIMMGMVAKISLLETQVANAPIAHDNLRRQSVPGAKDRPRGSSGGTARAAAAESSSGDAAPAPPPSYTPPPPSPYSAQARRGQGSSYGLPQATSQPNSAPGSAAKSDAASDGDDRFAAAQASIVRLTVVDHKEERSGVAAAVGEGGVLLTSAPLLAGAYEGWRLLPESPQKKSVFKHCLAHDPESRLAVVRVDDKDEPLTPLPLASVLPSKGARAMVFYETGQLEVGRAEAKVEALLSAGDVEKKLEIAVPDLGGAVWIELHGTFPQNMFGAPVINPAGQLAGVVLIDSKGTAGAQAPGPEIGRVFGAAKAPPMGMAPRRVYAVSSESLALLLERAASSAAEVLFTLDAPPLQKPPAPAASGRWSVKLASGATLDEKAFAFSPTAAGTLPYPGGGKCAMLSITERKTLDGTLIVYTPEGKELLRESFAQGRRHGPLTVMNSSGQCILAAEFDHDLRQGYCAYFKGGAPWLIQEYQEGRLGAQHLVKDGDVFHTVAAGSSLLVVNTMLAQYGAWPEWESRLKAVEGAVERWAKEATRPQRPGRSRPNTDQLNAAQREAIAAIDAFRKLVE